MTSLAGAIASPNPEATNNEDVLTHID